MTSGAGSAPARDDTLSKRDLSHLFWLLLLAAAVRIVYLLLADLPASDPWRHLLLVDNLRQGAGFTLFEGQPYLWYSPVWYRLCALFPASVPLDWIAGLLSLLSVPALYVLVRLQLGAIGRSAAVAAALLLAASGPLVEFTCHYGPEALALFLTLAALVVAQRWPGAWAGFVAGLLFGVAVAARLNFAFNLFLFLPALRNRRQGAAILGGTAIPLLLTWWRNHRIISGHPFVFTWDGLATPSADFDWLSTLVLQRHPALQEALRRLHEQDLPRPEWLWGASGPAWGLILFMLCGTLCVLAARRRELWLAVGLALGYFLFLDRSLSSHFFRIYLCVFPGFFIAAGVVADRLRQGASYAAAGPARVRAAHLLLAWAPVALILFAGAGKLRPAPGPFIEAFTPPPSLLRDDAYLVNSARYHPESLIYRYPGKRFAGLPLHPKQFEEFRLLYPDYRAVLWHDFSVQDEMKEYLLGEGGFRVVRVGVNADGRIYEVFHPPAQRGVESVAE